MGRDIAPVTREERYRLFSASMKHATMPNRYVNWAVFEKGYFRHQVIGGSSSSSDSDKNSSFGSDCIFMYENPGFPQRREICRYSPP